ncbi:hypothetical protein D3C72_96770 [compost metagenome]
MPIDFDPGNLGKPNPLLRRDPSLDVKGVAPAKGLDVFKQADADGNGAISRDEFTRFAKAALPGKVDLSKFGGGDLQLVDFDQALGDWVDSVGQAEASAVVSEKRSSLPPLDTGKTWANAAAEKVARGEPLNFGHNAVDGQLWKLQDGSPVWADTGTQVTREQLAAMPDSQVKSFYQMMGLGYDPQVDFPDPAERKKLADRVTIPDPTSSSGPAAERLQTILKDLDQLHRGIASREDALKGQLDGADAATSSQIKAQLAQLGGVRAHLETMQAELKDFRLPTGLGSEGSGRVMDALQQVHDGVKRLAGASASERGPIMADFALAMNQLRQPERDMRTDSLAQSQHGTLLDASRVLTVLGDRLDQLARQRPNADAATSAQIDAQMAQLQSVHQGFTQVAAPLFNYRADPALTDQDRQQKAGLIDQVHAQIKQMAGMDRDSFQRMALEAQQLLQTL